MTTIPSAPPAAKCLVAGRGPPRRRPRRPRPPPSLVRCQPARPPGRAPRGPPGPPHQCPPLPLPSPSSGASCPAAAGATPAPPCAVFGARSRPAAHPQWRVRPARPAYYCATPALTTRGAALQKDHDEAGSCNLGMPQVLILKFPLNSITLTVSNIVMRGVRVRVEGLLYPVRAALLLRDGHPGGGRPGRPATHPSPAESAQQLRIGS